MNFRHEAGKRKLEAYRDNSLLLGGGTTRPKGMPWFLLELKLERGEGIGGCVE